MTTPELSILVCTYRRPAFLAALLDALARQAGQVPTHEVIVVDNDPLQSGREIAARHPAVRYLCEPRPGVSHARNTALANARGSLLLLLDDDQLVGPDFLARLAAAWSARPAGPANIDGLRLRLVPWLEPGVPEALAVSGRLYGEAAPEYAPVERPAFGTGGLLVDAAVFRAFEVPFDPTFGLTGGEDTELFVRATRHGFRFAHSGAAPVFERITIERAGLAVRFVEQFRSGGLDAAIDRRHDLRRPRLGLRARLARIRSGEAITAARERLERIARQPHPLEALGLAVAHRLGHVSAPLIRVLGCGAPTRLRTRRGG